MLLLPLALGPTNMFSLLSSISMFFRLRRFWMWSLVIHGMGDLGFGVLGGGYWLVSWFAVVYGLY